MKKFVIFLSFVAFVSLTSSCNNSSGFDAIKRSADALTVEPPRPAGQTDVIGLRCDPIPIVRVAVIGLGMRGPGIVSRFMYMDGVEVKAICDLEQYNIDMAQGILRKNNRPDADVYMGEEDWKVICKRDDIDLILIYTHWDLHAPIAVYAMEQGKHVAMDIPAALTIEECWDLVNTAERTRRHCMMLENTCYDFFEMATLNMAQQGWFGEVVHVEGAYIHDLRGLNFRPRFRADLVHEPGVGMVDAQGNVKEPSGYWKKWRLRHNTERNGNLYPMHGLGPVAQILNIGRGDKMDYMVSMSSNQFNMTAFANEIFGANSEEAQTIYKRGDMNVSMIKTAKGKTIMLQHDVSSPRPYNRIHMVSGTKGFAQKQPFQQLAVNVYDLNSYGGYRVLGNEEMREVIAQYEHPITKEIGELARSVGGHGGMDFIMEYRLIYCLQNGLPLDMDVYDAASWSSIIPLSEFSVANGSYPVKIPDFTRGAWQKTKGFQHAFK